MVVRKQQVLLPAVATWRTLLTAFTITSDQQQAAVILIFSWGQTDGVMVMDSSIELILVISCLLSTDTTLQVPALGCGFLSIT